MFIRTIIMALLWVVLGMLSMQGSCVSQPPPAKPKRIIPKLVRVIFNQEAASPSLEVDSVSGSVASSPHPETSFSAEYFDAQHRIVELEVENERLKAENDLLRTELALAKASKPVVYQQPIYYAPRSMPANCSKGQCGPRGIFGRRR